ncbi:MAG: DNA polymerase III subunit delta [Clostridia bacterium]|nr:DNA polymerase III subunit delta [Clostridia bacterium]
MVDLAVLIGNAAVKRRLESGRGLSHAYILAGPTGCGKKTLANLLSAALVCSGGGDRLPCAHCPDCRKAQSLVHPDIIRVGEEGKDVNVAAVRAMRSDAYIRPNEAGRKVYVVEHAETMNQSAQNALLKLLEDGPPYAAFLLLTDNAGAMLQTVRSRCEVLSLSPVTPAEAEGYLLKRFSQLDRAQVLDAAQRCEGVLGRAVQWLEGNGEAAAENRAQAARLKGLLLGKSELALLEYCVGLESKDRDALGALLDETVQQLHEGLQSGDEPRRTLRLIERIKALRTALEFNAGPGHVAGALCASAF